MQAMAWTASAFSFKSWIEFNGGVRPPGKITIMELYLSVYMVVNMLQA